MLTRRKRAQAQADSSEAPLQAKIGEAGGPGRLQLRHQLRAASYDDGRARLRPDRAPAPGRALAAGGPAAVQRKSGDDDEPDEVDIEIAAKRLAVSYAVVSASAKARSIFASASKRRYLSAVSQRFDGLSDGATKVAGKAEDIYEKITYAEDVAAFVNQMGKASTAADRFAKNPDSFQAAHAWATATAACFGSLGRALAPVIAKVPLGGYISGLLRAPSAYVQAVLNHLKRRLSRADRYAYRNLKEFTTRRDGKPDGRKRH